VDILPGSTWRYSGGGYTVVQQMIIDVTGKPFPLFMLEAVLRPLGMDSSTFEQPLPAEKAKLAATGHLSERSLVKGRWHIYPEMAAAGLWTTPSDLLRFALGVQAAYSGKSGAVLSREMARQMLTVVKDNYGLGVGLQGSGRALRFGHGGRDEGFDARLWAYAETGQGVAIMINTNDNSQMLSRIERAVAREYHWPDSPPTKPATTSSRSLGHGRSDQGFPKARSPDGRVHLQSRQDCIDDVPVHVGKAAVNAVVAELEQGVVDAQEVQDRGVQVVAVGLAALSLPAPGVALTVGDAAFDACSGQPRH
jgi:CubicO group peptidase (beta-lactamase class C family)